MEPKKFSLEVPASMAEGTTNIESDQSIVIIGANGSGKTRLGTWIEYLSSKKELVYRISAQKSLTMPVSSSTTWMEYAKAELYFGYVDRNKPIEANFAKNMSQKNAYR